MIKVSIITINLNNMNGLIKTVESVVQQSYTNFEYIVIDGGSTDGSKEYISSRVSKFAYWASEADTGIYAAMNKGLLQAKGEYCLFLNSGDWLLQHDILENVFSKCHAEDVLICGCQISTGGSIVNTLSPPTKISLLSILKNSIPHQATFIKKELFELTGLYSESYKIHGDFEFWLRTIILKNCSVAALDIVVSNYNLEGISASSVNEKLSRKEVDTILNYTFPVRVLADYEHWKTYEAEMEIMNWVKSKQIFYQPIRLLYKMASGLNALNKKVFS